MRPFQCECEVGVEALVDILERTGRYGLDREKAFLVIVVLVVEIVIVELVGGNCMPRSRSREERGKRRDARGHPTVQARL